MSRFVAGVVSAVGGVAGAAAGLALHGAHSETDDVSDTEFWMSRAQAGMAGMLGAVVGATIGAAVGAGDSSCPTAKVGVGEPPPRLSHPRFP